MNDARVILCLFLLIAAALGRRVFRTYASPITIMVVPWLVVIAGQEVLVPDFPFGRTAALVIASAAGAFCGAAGVVALVNGGWGLRSEIPDIVITVRPGRQRLWRWLLRGLVALAAAELALDLYLAFYLGVGVRAEGSVNPYAFYDAVVGPYGQTIGVLYRASFTAVYLGALLLGVEVARHRRLTVGPVLFFGSIVAVSLFTTSKTFALLALSIVGLTSALMFPRAGRRLSAKQTLTCIFALVFVTAFVWGANYRRYGVVFTSGEWAGNVQAVYLFGAASGLSLYLDTSDRWIEGRFSGVCIGGPLEWLGFGKREVGVYTEVVLLGDYSVPTNQYTGLRLLLEDGGVGGMVIAMGLLGVIASTVFFRFYSSPTFAKCVLLSNLYLLLLWLPITLWTYYTFWTVGLVGLPVVGGWLVRLSRGSGATIQKEGGAVRRQGPLPAAGAGRW